MATLRVGLMGCGRIAQLAHLPALARMKGVELVALADSAPGALRAASRFAPRARMCESYEELLGVPELEAVVVSLPNALHAQVAIAALESGRHVYLEKPLATNLDEGRAVVEAWRRARVVGMIGFNYRFNKLYQEARRHVLSGALGELIAARSVFSSAEGDAPGWKRTRLGGGGALLDLASHHVDLARFFFGREVREVFAEVRSRRSEDDCAVLNMLMEGGLPVQSLFSTSAVEEDRFEVYGDAGKLSVDRHLSVRVRVTGPTMRRARLEQLLDGLRALGRSPYVFEKMRAPGFEPSYSKALEKFVASARAGEYNARPDFEDGYRSLAVVEAAEESARTRRAVAVVNDHEGLAP